MYRFAGGKADVSSVLLSVVLFCLPSRPDKTRFLTEDERLVACTRLNAEAQGNQDIAIDWKAVRHALSDWRLCESSLPYKSSSTERVGGP